MKVLYAGEQVQHVGACLGAVYLTSSVAWKTTTSLYSMGQSKPHCA